MMELRRSVLMYDSIMQGNKYDPAFVYASNANYTVSTGKNYVRISKSTSSSYNYGRGDCLLENLNLVAGRKYKLRATIKDCSRSDLMGWIYITNSSSTIIGQTAQLTTVQVGDKLEMDFTYNPNTMTRLAFVINSGFSVPIDSYIVYSDILILPQ